MRRLIYSLIIGAISAVCHHLAAAPPQVRPDELPHSEPTAPEQAAETFVVRPGFRLELVAAEPLIADPVAVAIDEDGRAFVAEMRDYSERRAEKLGRIKLLTDTNGDGRYDQATVFAEGLAWPTALACWDGGLFVVASPDLLYLKDTDGDQRADVRALVFTGFGNKVERLNVQALPNSLQWGPDQRFHLALGGNASLVSNFAISKQPAMELRGKDLAFDPRDLWMHSEPGGGQWGLTFDDWGRKYVCSNSHHLQQVMIPAYAQQINPALSAMTVDIAADGPQAEVYRASPVEPWRILRTQWRVTGVVPGLVEGGGRASGYFTSACGLTIYRGNAYPAEYYGQAFVCDCGGNLIHRKILSGEIRAAGKRAPDEAHSEFVSGKDNWFRPVALANAPDGCLWVCDMYREVVEHPWSLPEPIKSQLDLNAGNDRGRLWRIVPDGFQSPALPRLSAATSAQLVELLSHPNGWHRDTAARLLHQRQDAAAIPLLNRVIQEGKSPLGRLTAWRVLCATVPVDELPWESVVNDPEPIVREAAAQWLGAAFAGQKLPAEYVEHLEKLTHDKHGLVRFYVALAVPAADAEDRARLAMQLAEGDLSSADLRNAIAAAAGDASLSLLVEAVKSSAPSHQQFAQELAVALGERGKQEEVNAAVKELATSGAGGPILTSLADGLRRGGKSLRGVVAPEMLTLLARKAEQQLLSAEATSEQKQMALGTLGLTGNAKSLDAVASFLTPTRTKAEAVAALDAVVQLHPTDLSQRIIKLWPVLPSQARPYAVQLLVEHPASIPDLLAAIEATTIASTDISATEIARLRAANDSAVKAKVEKIFGPVGSREAAIGAFQKSLQLDGVATKGEAIFQKKCALCHRKNGAGHAVGPDLDAVASAGKEKIFTNLLDPSREVTAGYVTGMVATGDGEVTSGVILAEGNGSVTLKLPEKEPRYFAKSEIEQFQRSSKSLMPDGLEVGLTPQDVADLLEYLVTGRARE